MRARCKLANRRLLSPSFCKGTSLGRAACVACRRDEWWDAEFAAGVHFKGDLLVAVPDVVEAALQEDDEFLVLATDGLWCARPPLHIFKISVKSAA